ncbi:hypothetical protein JCM9534A_75300 [Catenuloplanes indicus JCM 9534]
MLPSLKLAREPISDSSELLIVHTIHRDRHDTRVEVSEHFRGSGKTFVVTAPGRRTGRRNGIV